MRLPFHIQWGIPVLFLGLLLSSCKTSPFSKSLEIKATQNGGVVFQDTVRPVLEHRCIQCHNNEKPSAGLNFQNREQVLAGNDGGPFLVPGKPEESRIWRALMRPADHPRPMPADGWGIDKYDLEAFEAWIEAGAAWPIDESGQLQIKEYQVTRRGYL